MQFTSNVGSLDRIFRIILGALLLVLAMSGTIGAWGWLGVILIATAFLKFCPIYRVLGLRTTKEV